MKILSSMKKVIKIKAGYTNASASKSMSIILSELDKIKDYCNAMDITDNSEWKDTLQHLKMVQISLKSRK